MVRVAIVGCGRVADQHVEELRYIPDTSIVGFCDVEELLAAQMVERWSTGAAYSDIAQMIEETHPDVIHITTPPQSHYALGMMCLEANCHVLMEKPFALNTVEAAALIDKARSARARITVCHNAQYSHAAIRMRRQIRNGVLGGPPVHMESVWCFPFTDPGYAKAILGDSGHWIRSLPGRYLHDILPHGIARIAEYVHDEPYVSAVGTVSPLLTELGEHDIIDELRVIISDRRNMTAYYTFSSQITPPVKQFRMYGPRGSLILDHNRQTVVRIPRDYPYYLNHFIGPLSEARSHIGNAFHNMSSFVQRRHYFEYGRRYLISEFYKAIETGAPAPVTECKILVTSQIMDCVFAQLAQQITSPDDSHRPVSRSRAT